MITRSQLLRLTAAGVGVVCFSGSVFAQNTIKIGELNSYKSQPAFLDPYK
jgi:branched-chain amino acid transport system substrate-binding protein